MEGVWLQRLLKYKLTDHPLKANPHLSPTLTLEIDNQSCITLLKVPKNHENTKHIDYKYFFVAHLRTREIWKSRRLHRFRLRWKPK